MTTETTTRTLHTIRITIGGENDADRIAGTVKTDGSYVSAFDGVVGGRFVDRFPQKAVRQIAQDWVFDGANRSYSGWLDDLATDYSVAPA